MLYRKNKMIIENTVHFYKKLCQLLSKSSHIEPKESRFESITQLLKFIVIISSIIKIRLSR